jgi:hypothetical protein
MNKLRLLFLLLVIVNSYSSTYAFAEADEPGLPENDFNRTFVGTINNKIDVVFSLKNKNGQLTGFYYYNKIGVEINLIGNINHGNVVLYELDYQNIKRAKITCQLLKNTFFGKWEDLSTGKLLPVQLKQTNQSIPLLPKTLIGTYRLAKEEGCNLTIEISKSKGGYYYHFKSTKRTLKGKVTFSRSLNEKVVYINLNGIEWAGYRGDISRLDPEDEGQKIENLPTTVEGLLSDNEIIIQNYGNAMNSYTKLGECSDEKYIHLKKY